MPVCVHACVCVCEKPKTNKTCVCTGTIEKRLSNSLFARFPYQHPISGQPQASCHIPLVPLSMCPLLLHKPQLTSVRASFDVLIVPFGFYSLSIHTQTHTHMYIPVVVVVTVCIRHLPFCGQCVLLLLLLLFAYAYLPLNDAAGVVAALYFALPPPLPSAAASVFDSTFAFAPASAPASATAFCLYLAPFAVSISVAIPVPILYPRASLRILVELLLKVQHWQRAWA